MNELAFCLDDDCPVFLCYKETLLIGVIQWRYPLDKSSAEVPLINYLRILSMASSKKPTSSATKEMGKNDIGPESPYAPAFGDDDSCCGDTKFVHPNDAFQSFLHRIHGHEYDRDDDDKRDDYDDDEDSVARGGAYRCRSSGKIHSTWTNHRLHVGVDFVYD
ncbi:unnamed protein product [Didymodactylos carnosus]|uniref:Uncharacterized protein n=1 Tax=Didymodactylos carnosus TaxID=1234261 RepID=A0A814PAZ9_9BILA|nr:unnamed protein product [Didymodactylos carnosus]CAF1103215.1 unnamed protein product [Didymodactylos carnosus]CAF3776202.1 unnamed protein product [Didymodactylos carnosus]CAF3867977.1 unnamed protein product [Didymodactylos carnosus]